MLGTSLNEPDLFPKRCVVRRQGDLLSQLANSKKLGEATFFVVDCADKNQLLATKAGMKFQKLENSVYLPTIIAGDEEGDPKNEATHVVRKLDGRVQTVRTVPARNMDSATGKIVTMTGTKNVVADLRQNVTIQETGEVVHFVMPWQELKAKGCLQYWRERGVEGTAFLNGKLVKGWVVKLEAFRTLNPGENLRGRRRVASLKGYAAWFMLGIGIHQYHVSVKNPITGKHEWRIKEDLHTYDPKKWEYWHILHHAARQIDAFAAEAVDTPYGGDWV
jgi:hypothetical protein